MADAHDAKGDAHGDAHGGASATDFKAITKFFAWLIIIGLAILATVLIVFVDPQTAQNFIYFLNGLEILFLIYLIANVYKFYGYYHKFEHYCHHIQHIYDHKYHPEKKSSVTLTPEELRFERAKAHINSSYKEEWKIGVIELDTILKDLLKAKYKGDTVGDLLNDAEKNGFKSISTAWEAHKVRNKIVHEGIKYEFDKAFAERVLRNYVVAFHELGLSEESKAQNAEEDEHDDHHH